MMAIDDYYEKFNSFIVEHEIFPKNSEVNVLYSGGLDSTALLIFMRELSNIRPDIKVKPLCIGFPNIVYRIDYNNTKQLIKTVSDLEFIKVGETDDVLENIDSPCKLCKEIRHNKIKEIIKTKETTEKTVIATAHNFSDLLAYYFELKDLNYEKLNNDFLSIDSPIIISDEKLKQFSKFFPKLKLNDITIVRPMLSFSRDEVKHILDKTNNYVSINECPYHLLRYKRRMFKYLESNKKKINLTYEQLIDALETSTQNFVQAKKQIKSRDYSELLV